MIVRYYRRGPKPPPDPKTGKQGRRPPRGVVIFSQAHDQSFGSGYLVTWSLAHHNDIFSKSKGLGIAVGRARKMDDGKTPQLFVSEADIPSWSPFPYKDLVEYDAEEVLPAYYEANPWNRVPPSLRPVIMDVYFDIYGGP